MSALTKRIMVIEDDKEIRETIQYALEVDGYSVITQSNGLEALNSLSNSPLPGLILLDLTMPVMSGTEFVEKMKERKQNKDVPIVVLTAARNKPRPADVADFLNKPIDLDKLLEIAHRYCGDQSKPSLPGLD